MKFGFHTLSVVLFLLPGSSFGQTYHLENSRTVTIDLSDDENGTQVIRITDSAGPSERSQFPLWEAGRKILPGENRSQDSWSQDPTPERLALLNGYAQTHHFESAQDGLVQPGQKSWYGHAMFTRDLPSPPLYTPSEYGKPLTIEIRSNSLSQWESIPYLREEAMALAKSTIEEFVNTNKSKLGNLIASSNTGNFIVSESELQRTSDQKRVLSSYLKLSQGERYMTGSHQGADHLIDQIELKERLKSGHYNPAIHIKRHYSDEIDHPALLVVHAHGRHGGCTIQPELDPLIAQFKELNRPVFYLMAGESIAKTRFEKSTRDHPLSWKTTDRSPTAAIYSEYGHHFLKLSASSVVVTGANWAQCHESAILDAIDSHYALSNDHFTVHIPASAVTGMEAHIHDKTLEDYFRGLSDKKIFKKLIQGDFASSISMRKGGLISPDFKLDQDYQLKFWLDNRELGTLGQGPRTVDIKIWTKDRFKEFFSNQAIQANQTNQVF